MRNDLRVSNYTLARAYRANELLGEGDTAPQARLSRMDAIDASVPYSPA